MKLESQHNLIFNLICIYQQILDVLCGYFVIKYIRKNYIDTTVQEQNDTRTTANYETFITQFIGKHGKLKYRQIQLENWKEKYVLKKI